MENRRPSIALRPNPPQARDPAILIVEDDRHLRRVVRVYLQDRGFRVFEAADGVQALGLVQVVCPSVILLDLMLPRLDGVSALKQLVTCEDTFDIPVIVMSARGDALAKSQVGSLGAAAYVEKPFSLADLLSRIRCVMRRGGQRPPKAALSDDEGL